MRTNYVLVDFENVTPDVLPLLPAEYFKVIVFVGDKQTKVPFELANAMQSLGDRASYLKISGTGQNALDFHIAYMVGVLSTTDSTACFHIVSKDTGFDPLIAHLKSKKIVAIRSASVQDIPSLKADLAKSPPQRLQLLKDRLKTMKGNPPGTVRTLTTTTAALFNKTLPEPEIKRLIDMLVKEKSITIEGTRVTYL